MLVAALLLVLLLPGPVAADTCACDPIQPYLAVDRFDEVHVTYRHSDRPGVIYATNKTGTWTRKRLTSARDVPYAIAVDARQRGYVVFQREVDDHMRWQLLTNRTGEWVLSRLSIIPADAYRVRIEIAPDRSIHLTFDRDEAVYYATNASGSWVRRRLDSAMGNNARLALDAAGNVHLVYQQCIDDGTDSCLEPGIYYETNACGTWATERVSFDGEDSSQDILVDASGTVHIAFARGVQLAGQPGPAARHVPPHQRRRHVAGDARGAAGPLGLDPALADDRHDLHHLHARRWQPRDLHRPQRQRVLDPQRGDHGVGLLPVDRDGFRGPAAPRVHAHGHRPRHLLLDPQDHGLDPFRAHGLSGATRPLW